MSKYSPRNDVQRRLPPDEKAARIAQSLAELSVASDGRSRTTDPIADSEEVEISEETVNWLLRARRERTRYLRGGIFGDPMWEMLLHLLHAEITHRRPSISTVCLASDLPEQAALRWVDAMTQRGFVSVQDDPDLAGGRLIELLPGASRALRRYVRDVVGNR